MCGPSGRSCPSSLRKPSIAARRCCGACSGFTSRWRCRMALTGCSASGGHHPAGVIEPLSVEQVARFWSSFRTARDIAVVGLLLLSGLRSCEVLALELEDLLLSEAQLRVRGKGGKVRMMPLPPETIRLLDGYLKTERPLTNAAQVFVSLKGKARGQPMTKDGLRSLFRHHRALTTIQKANPHRFRHTFGSDMIRAGVSLPALQRLMGHANIETTLLYIQISPQDVYEEYARAVAKRVTPARIAQP